jgi:hypothetical protein
MFWRPYRYPKQHVLGVRREYLTAIVFSDEIMTHSRGVRSNCEREGCWSVCAPISCHHASVGFLLLSTE